MRNDQDRSVTRLVAGQDKEGKERASDRGQRDRGVASSIRQLLPLKCL